MRLLAALLGTVGLALIIGAIVADPAGRLACERTHTPATCTYMLRG